MSNDSSLMVMPCACMLRYQYNYVSTGHAYIDPLRRQERCYVSLNEKNETCNIVVSTELKNAEFLTVQLLRPTMKSKHENT